MSKKLTVSYHMDGMQIESFSEDQLKALGNEVSRVMSDYYSLNVNEFKILKEGKKWASWKEMSLTDLNY